MASRGEAKLRIEPGYWMQMVVPIARNARVGAPATSRFCKAMAPSVLVKAAYFHAGRAGYLGPSLPEQRRDKLYCQRNANEP